MKDLKNYPSIPNVENPVAVDASRLTSIGVNTGAYAVREGDVISFDSDESVVEQPITGSNNKAYYITCTRNGKLSFISAGQLTRRAYVNGTFGYVGTLQEKLGMMPSLKERLEYVAGKTFKGSAPMAVETAVFENGVRTDKKQTLNISILTENA